MSAMSATSVILEIGEHTCRIGIEHDNFPRLQIPSYELGVCFSNWTDETNLQMIAKMSSLWFQKLCIKPRDFKVLVIEHILVNEKFRKDLAIALLHVFGFQSISFQPGLLLPMLLCSAPGTGLVVDLGHNESRCIVVVDYRPIDSSLKFSPMGIKRIVSYFSRHVSVQSPCALFERLSCLSSTANKDFAMQYEAAISLFLTGVDEAEGFVDDDCGGVLGMILASIKQRPVLNIAEILSNIMFIGGGSMISGMTSRICYYLQQKVSMSCQPSNHPSYPCDCRSWMGGAIFARIKSNASKYFTASQLSLYLDDSTAMLPHWSSPDPITPSSHYFYLLYVLPSSSTNSEKENTTSNHSKGDGRSLSTFKTLSSASTATSATSTSSTSTSTSTSSSKSFSSITALKSALKSSNATSVLSTSDASTSSLSSSSLSSSTTATTATTTSSSTPSSGLLQRLSPSVAQIEALSSTATTTSSLARLSLSSTDKLPLPSPPVSRPSISNRGGDTNSNSNNSSSNNSSSSANNASSHTSISASISSQGSTAEELERRRSSLNMNTTSRMTSSTSSTSSSSLDRVNELLISMGRKPVLPTRGNTTNSTSNSTDSSHSNSNSSNSNSSTNK